MGKDINFMLFLKKIGHRETNSQGPNCNSQAAMGVPGAESLESKALKVKRRNGHNEQA